MRKWLANLDPTGVLLDVALFASIEAVFFTNQQVIAFHIAFVLVVAASLRVGLLGLIFRLVPTGIGVLAALLVAHSKGEIPVDELYELPLLGAVVVMVYVNATRRDRLTEKTVEQRSQIEELHRAGQRELQDQLVVTQRLQMNDRLNAAVAHDVNNALSGIQLLAENLADGLTSKLKTMSIGRTLEHRVSEAGEILQELLESARITNSPDPQPPADLQGSIEATEPLLRRLCGRPVVLDVTHSGPTARLAIPRIRLVQALVNLTLNAVDASTESDALVKIESRIVGDDAIVSVTDNGSGMSEEVLSHIFEPYFTSKSCDGGTGLGLFAVRELIEGAGGSVDVKSSPGSGTTFQLRIPTLRANVEDAVAHPSMSPSVRRSALRIIIADDDPTIRDALAQGLRAAGHYVTTAVDGNDALALINSFDGTLDVLIADMMMPGLSGINLTRRMSGTHPDMPVILMSGFERLKPETLEGDQTVRFLHKPFTVAELLTDLQIVTSNRP